VATPHRCEPPYDDLLGETVNVVFFDVAIKYSAQDAFGMWWRHAMSDLEFQRALSPDQLREAHSLLDGTACAKLRNMQVGDLRSDDVVDPGADQASTIATTQNQLPAAEGAQKQRGHLSLAAAFYSLGITAAAALTLLSWSERSLTPPYHPALPEIPGEHVQNQQPAQLANGVAPTPPVSNPASDQSSHGSEQWRSHSEVAANRGDDQAAVIDATNKASAIPHVAQTATIAGIAMRQASADEQAARKSKEPSPRHSAARVAAGKKRSWRRHWQPLMETNGNCFLAICPSWQKRRAFYEPPRNVNQ